MDESTNLAVHQSAGSGKVWVFESAAEVAGAAADLFTVLARTAIADRGRFRVALSGGSTPARTYEMLAAPQRASQVEWDKVDIFWGDERYVPADDPESNYRMTREALLRHVPLPPKNVYRIETEITPPRVAATAYEDALRACFGMPTGVPRFDLVFLGLGPDGHTASLFPNSPVLHEAAHLVAADFVAKFNQWRISMTARVFNAAHTVAFLVAGQDKAPIFRDVLCSDEVELPAQLIQPAEGPLWIVDRAVASLVG